jgi:electron transfer flavoprotein beta subunit
MIAACLKWVATRPAVDPLTGGVDVDPRAAGASEADRAALEWALRTGEAWGEEVVAFTLGPPAAESVLREALAAGVTRAVRIDAASDIPSDMTAAALAGQLKSARAVWCGDISLDRGSGSVPAFLAAHLEAEQATGLIAAELGDGRILAVRRLDGGRRERLRVRPIAVLSVEGATARLRRASLAGEIAARRAPITIVAGPVHKPVVEAITRPFRPRPRVLAPPAGVTARERIAALTAVGTATAGRVDPVHLSPVDAADRLLAALADWGYRRSS